MIRSNLFIKIIGYVIILTSSYKVISQDTLHTVNIDVLTYHEDSILCMHLGEKEYKRLYTVYLDSSGKLNSNTVDSNFICIEKNNISLVIEKNNQYIIFYYVKPVVESLTNGNVAILDIPFSLQYQFNVAYNFQTARIKDYPVYGALQLSDNRFLSGKKYPRVIFKNRNRAMRKAKKYMKKHMIK